MKPKRITMTVEIEEHTDDTVSIRVLDARGELFTRKENISTWDAAREIGACAFELPTEAELG